MVTASNSVSPEVDVVLAVLNGGPRFEKCLDAIRSQEGVHFRLVVVDNGSTDGSAELGRGKADVYLEEPRRSAYAARNLGLTHCVAPVVAFTDADCVPDPSWLRRGVDCLLGGGAELAAGRVSQERASTTWGRHDELTYLNQEFNVAHGFGATANLFVRSGVFKRIGGFDSSLLSGGDLNLCTRAVSAGFNLVYCGEAEVSHAPREGARAVLRKAWRISVGHGELMASGQRAVRPSLSWRRLLPHPEVRRHQDSAVTAIDVVVRFTWYLGRLYGMARHRLVGWFRTGP